MKQASAIIISNDQDQILLLKRGEKQRDEQGKWENMGGEVDPGETFEQTAIRECMEELSLEVSDLQRLFVDEDPEGSWKVVVFTAKAIGDPKNNEPEFIDAIEWFDKSELKNVDLATYTRRDFERLGWV